MKKNSIILLLFFVSNTSDAQDSVFIAKAHRIGFSSTDLLISQILLSYEYQYSLKNILEANFGYGFNPIALSFINSNFFFYEKKILGRINRKFLIKTKNKKKYTEHWVGTSVSFVNTSYSHKNVTVYFASGPGTTYIQSKNNNCFSLEALYSIKRIAFNKINMEYYGGIGAGYNKSLIIKHGVADSTLPISQFFPIIDKEEKVLPSGQIGIKIFFPLK